MLVDRWSLFVDRCVTTVEYVRIAYRNRLLVWIKSCCYVGRYCPLDLFEPASGVVRIPQHSLHTSKNITNIFVMRCTISKCNFITRLATR